jgi:hypothetical protein
MGVKTEDSVFTPWFVFVLKIASTALSFVVHKQENKSQLMGFKFSHSTPDNALILSY